MEQIYGKLAHDVLPDVLRHLRILLESGRLAVWSDAKQGVLVVRDGRPVHAACRYPDGSAAQGFEALAMMLRWPSGHYSFRDESVDGDIEADRRDPTAAQDADRFVLPGESRNGSDSLRGDTEQVLAHARSLFGSGTSVESDEGSEGSDRTESGDVTEVGSADPGLAESDFDDPDFDDLALHDTALDNPVLHRTDMIDPTSTLTVSRGALELWLRLDGTVPLEALRTEMGEAMPRMRVWAHELQREGLARAVPEPVYGRDFVARLVSIVNEIMGPMGEIVVEDALEAHGVDPAAVPDGRVDALVDELAGQLQRSDWQLKLRARVARLRVEVGPHA